MEKLKRSLMVDIFKLINNLIYIALAKHCKIAYATRLALQTNNNKNQYDVATSMICIFSFHLKKIEDHFLKQERPFV